MAPANEGFVARANVKVVNNSPVPQTIAGTGVVPFQLMPKQEAQLEMRGTPPPAPPGGGNGVPPGSVPGGTFGMAPGGKGMPGIVPGGKVGKGGVIIGPARGPGTPPGGIGIGPGPGPEDGSGAARKNSLWSKAMTLPPPLPLRRAAGGPRPGRSWRRIAPAWS